MLSTLLIGVFIGVFITLTFIFSSIKIKEQKVKKQNQSIYQEILDKVNSDDVTFGSRINNTVQLNTNIKSEGEVQIMYFLDKKEIAIFRGNDCLYTSILIENNVLDKISTAIWGKFSNQINDIVFLSNNAFDKKTFVVISGLNQNIDLNTGEIIDDVFTNSYNLDDILDKINKVGYDNLTEAEKEFLKNMK